MDVDRFKDSPVGRLVAVTVTDRRGGTFHHFAFVPSPLPDEIQLSGRSQKRLEEATLSLGRLDGAARRLPNPRLLARPLIRREAVSSSALEGTYTTIQNVLEAEHMDEEEIDASTAEVRNYVRALEKGVDSIASRPTGLNSVKDLHGELMHQARGHTAGVGEFRTEQNWIGRRPSDTILESSFVPPPPGDELNRGLGAWEEWNHQDDDIPLLVRVALSHYQFETIHPFIDGNGRVGRLLAVLLLIEKGALSVPLLSLSPYLEARRDEYLESLRAVSATGDFDHWIGFFLAGVRDQAEQSLETAEGLLELKDRMLAVLRERRVFGVATRITESLIGYPVMSVRQAANIHDVGYVAANNAFARLVDAGLLTEITGKSYGRLFAATSVLELMR